MRGQPHQQGPGIDALGNGSDRARGFPQAYLSITTMIESTSGYWLISYLQPIKPLLFTLLGLDEWITLVLVGLMIFFIYRNVRNYKSITQEMDTLFRRYLLFRSDKQITLKMHEQDEKIRNEILRSISNSWKHFRRIHGELVDTLLGNIRKTLLAFYVILGILFINTLRVLLTDWFKTGEIQPPLGVAVKEVPSYLLLILGFLLIRIQTSRRSGDVGRPFEIKPETIFPDIGIQDRSLYDEFEPIDEGEGDGEIESDKAGTP
ncbi:MAG: hypothetical protein JSW70_04370 [Syntrophobacterales bacterium]|nr:MAG: hypothetical protein JSW70_04370 [Syntrophobacterales bacterium]